jgi:shikimate dehydrogenase
MQGKFSAPGDLYLSRDRIVSRKGFRMKQDRFFLAGLMGDPVMHSRSPLLHNYWLKHYGLAGSYVLLAIKPENLEPAIKALPALGFAGCNLTIPHKEAAMAMMDHVDPVAKRIGAMNCVVVGPDGRLSGFNNDGYGYIEGIREEHPDWRADTGPVVVIGAGGGARAVVSALCDAGAPEVRLINRTQERAERLAEEYGAPVKAHPWQDREAALSGAAMLVNTTSLGMDGQPPLDLALDRLSRHALVSDIIYIPKETPLLLQARLRGNPVSNGLGMLIHQARPAFKAWFGILPIVTPELRTAIEASTA